MSRTVYKMQPVSVRWGDYGSVLHHGISWNRERIDGRIQLERTGPFVSQLTMPSHDVVVVTAALRDRMSVSGLLGFDFRPVLKSRIVKLEWEKWPPADEPDKYPAGGEPENYVLRRKHDDASAQALGELWELVPAGTASSVRNERGTQYHLEVEDVDVDFWLGMGLGVYVSERARDWLEREVQELVAFSAVDAQ